MKRAVIFLFLLAAPLRAQDGAAVYTKHCGSCHDASATARAPARDALRQLSPERIVASLESGTMSGIGNALSPAERIAVARSLSGRDFGAPDLSVPQSAMCKDPGDFTNPFAGAMWNGFGGTVANRRYQNPALAALSAADVPNLKLKWAFGFPGDIAAAAQPAVAGGRLFVGSRGLKVYALNAASACIHWAFTTDSGVRTAITIGSTSGNYAAYFGDLQANVYSVDAITGKQLWKVRVDDHPNARITGSPLLHEGRLYVPVSSFEEGAAAAPAYECCTFRGSLVALDPANGRVIWKAYTIADAPKPTKKNSSGVQQYGPSGAAVWSTPTVDIRRRTIYVATGDSYSGPAAPTSDAILAFALADGKLLWSRQLTEGDAWNISCVGQNKANCPEESGPDFDFGSSPILVEMQNRERLLIIGQKSGIVHALDPDKNGEIRWQQRVGKGGMLGGVQWGPAADGQNVYAAVSDVALLGGGRLDPRVGGGLHALRLADGVRVWSAPVPECGDRRPCSPAQSAAVTVIQGIVFSGSLDGHLRAYSTSNGQVVWDFDTAKEFATGNGVKARGGSIDGAGPVVAGGMVFVNSGYGNWGGMPGNVLLGFSVGGK